MNKNKVQVAYPVGLTIMDVRAMTKEEIELEGWEDFNYVDTSVIILSDGGKIYASCDPEGNGPGCLYGQTNDGQQIYISPLEDIQK